MSSKIKSSKKKKKKKKRNIEDEQLQDLLSRVADLERRSDVIDEKVEALDRGIHDLITAKHVAQCEEEAAFFEQMSKVYAEQTTANKQDMESINTYLHQPRVVWSGMTVRGVPGEVWTASYATPPPKRTESELLARLEEPSTPRGVQRAATYRSMSMSIPRSRVPLPGIGGRGRGRGGAGIPRLISVRSREHL